MNKGIIPELLGHRTTRPPIKRGESEAEYIIHNRTNDFFLGMAIQFLGQDVVESDFVPFGQIFKVNVPMPGFKYTGRPAFIASRETLIDIGKTYLLDLQAEDSDIRYYPNGTIIGWDITVKEEIPAMRGLNRLFWTVLISLSCPTLTFDCRLSLKTDRERRVTIKDVVALYKSLGEGFVIEWWY